VLGGGQQHVDAGGIHQPVQQRGVERNGGHGGTPIPWFAKARIRGGRQDRRAPL
jgi:hypothetical protein